MNNNRFATYTEDDRDIVRQGIDAIKNKKIIFLGSSVTYGEASGGVSFVEELGRRNGYQTFKEAVSGTTLVDEGPDSYVSRLKRIKTGSANLFVCQLSTNDASCKKPLGKVSKDMEAGSFDVKTVAGAIEYIISYALKRWGCRILFYTSPEYGSKEYDKMVKLLKEVASKWNIEILDLWNDKEFNDISSDDRARFMADPIHPTLEGYKEWWTPKFEEAVRELI